MLGDKIVDLEDENNELRAENKRYREALEDAVNHFESDSVQGSGDYHFGIHCGLEDVNITDRYEACDYGHGCAVRRVRDEIIIYLEQALSNLDKE